MKYKWMFYLEPIKKSQSKMPVFVKIIFKFGWALTLLDWLQFSLPLIISRLLNGCAICRNPEEKISDNLELCNKSDKPDDIQGIDNKAYDCANEEV